MYAYPSDFKWQFNMPITDRRARVNSEEEEIRLENEGKTATPHQSRRRSACVNAQSFNDDALETQLELA